MNKEQQSNIGYPVIKTKFTNTIDKLSHEIITNNTNMSQQVVKELIETSGFQSDDSNSFRLIAHFVDMVMGEIGEQMISKKDQGNPKRDFGNQAENDQKIQIQITTEDILKELELRGLDLMNPFVYPEIDPQNLKNKQD